jgi:hypothetical protein
MAELGSINTTNPNAGTRPTDTRALEAGISQALGVVEKVHTQNVINEAVEDVEGDIQAVVDEAQGVEVQEPIDAALDPEVDELRREIADLQSDVVNGTSAQATRAQLKIGQTLTQLRKANPRLAAQIESTVASVVRTSPQMAALGIEDDRLAAQAVEARKQLTFMRDKAVKRWSEGGLGMAFNSDFSDPKVIAEFLERDQKRAAVNATQMETAVLKAGGSDDGKALLQKTNELLIGAKSGLTEHVAEQQRELGEYFDELRKPPEEQNADVIDSFTSLREAVLFQNTQTKFEMIEGFDTIWNTVVLRSSPEFTLAKAMLDDRIKLMDDFSAGVTAAKDSKYYDLQEAAVKSEAWGLRHEIPGYNQFLQWQALDPDGNIYRMIKDSGTGADKTVMELTSSAGIKLATQFWGYQTPADEVSGLFLNSGRNQITPSMTMTDVQNTLLKQQQQGPYPIDAKTVSETDELQAGMARIAGYQQNFQSMAASPENATPLAAAEVLTASAGMFLLYNQTGNPAADQTDASLDMLADAAVLNGIRLTGDGVYKNRRHAFGAAAQVFLGDGNKAHAKARTQNQQAFRGARLGATLADFISVQFYDEDSDRLSFEVNRDAVAKAAYNESKTALPSAIQGPTEAQWIRNNGPTIDLRIRAINDEANRILDFANKDIRANAHVMFANAQTVENALEPSYRLWADRSGWLDVLGGQ